MIIISETKRLIIRTWEKSDFAAAKKLWGNPEVTRYIVKTPLTSEQIREKFVRELHNQKEFSVQYWAITLKESGEIIGCCGLRPYQIENRIYEIGFHIMQEHWGKNYAREAAQAVIEYAFNILNASQLVAGHHPNNAASKHLLETLGFQWIGNNYYEPTGLNHPSYKLLMPSSFA